MEAQAGAVKRITGKELRERLQKGEDIVIVDARALDAYEDSNIKPKDSVRIPPGSTDGEIARLPKDRLIVTV